MRIAIVDERAEALGIALLARQDGNDVMHGTAAEPYARAGWGLLPKARPHAIFAMNQSYDLFAYFAHGMGAQAQALRALGRTVIGGNSWIERLEYDEAFLASTAKTCGLARPAQATFNTPDEAVEAIKADPRKYVVRCGNDRPFASDVPALLESHVRRGRGPITISEYIPGVELYAETWYLNGVNIFTTATLENRRFLDGDMGAEVDAQTTVSWLYPMREPRIYQSVLKKIEALVSQQKYSGPIGVRVIVSEKDRKPYLLGFSTRSFRHVHAARAAMGFSLDKFVQGGAVPSIPAFRGFVYTATVSVPPYPCAIPGAASLARGLAVISPKGNAVIFHDIEEDPSRAGAECVAGTSGIVADVFGLGFNVEDARHQAVRACDEILVEGKQARRGGGATKLGRDVMRLSILGYETPRSRAKEMVP